MKLILMRHGQAEAYKESDNSRQLTEFGYQQAQQTATYIMAHYQPSIFVVSPYDRAQQTLDAFRAIAPDIEVSVHPDITPSDDAMQALSSLADVEGDCILVVCHMPIVAKLAALVSATDPESYALAEARIFDMDIVAADMGEEIDRFVPKQP